MVRAFVFLRSGARSVFADATWPMPREAAAAEWVTSDPGSPGASVSGYRIGDLPYWTSDELWEVELASPVTVHETRCNAPAGRLIARIDMWNAATATRFATNAVMHSRDGVAAALVGPAGTSLRSMATVSALALVAAQVRSAEGFFGLDEKGTGAAVRMVGEAADDLRLGLVPLALHEAAVAIGMVAARGAGGDVDVFEAAMRGEREWQAVALADQLDLA